MDSADSAPAQQCVLMDKEVLEHHKQMLQLINQQLAALTQALAKPILLVSPVASPHSVSSQLPVSEPPAHGPLAPPQPTPSELYRHRNPLRVSFTNVRVS